MPTDYEKMLVWSRRRKARILALRARKWSFAKIAAELKISPQRVQQIAKT